MNVRTEPEITKRVVGMVSKLGTKCSLRSLCQLSVERKHTLLSVSYIRENAVRNACKEINTLESKK